MDSAPRPEPERPSPAYPLRMRALQRAQAPPLPTKQPFSLTLPLFRSIDFQPIQFAHRSCAPEPGCNPPVRKSTCITRRFTSLTPSHSKPKTVAIAAFLGDSGFYRQKAADCCGKVTILGLETAFCTGIRVNIFQRGCVAAAPVNNSGPIS